MRGNRCAGSGERSELEPGAANAAGARLHFQQILILGVDKSVQKILLLLPYIG